MEPLRRAALIEATIAEVGSAGTLDVTMARIAQRAGASSALAHHYFGGKEQLFCAAMRHILQLLSAGVRDALAGADAPRARLEGIVRASFLRSNLLHELRPLVGPRAPDVAETLAALIDGASIRAALSPDEVGGDDAARRTLAPLDLMLELE